MNYISDVISQNDYYPFGMLLPNRHEASNEYRWGFNGMEKDDEIDGVEGSKLDFGARIYDSRIGRWLSADAHESNYPNISTYTYVLNSPLVLIDPDGNDPEPPVRLYIVAQYSGKKKSKGENKYFRGAARKIQLLHKYVLFGRGDIQKSKNVRGGSQIIAFVNSQKDNSITSLDYFGHGGQPGLYFSEEKTSNGVIKDNLYQKSEDKTAAEAEPGTNPTTQRSVTLDDINPQKFKDDARIEIHGCSTGGDDVDNWQQSESLFSAAISQKLYDAGKKNVIVIAHVGEAGPDFPGYSGKGEESDYADYRQNFRRVYWNGKMIYQTNARGDIDEATIDQAKQNFIETGEPTIVPWIPSPQWSNTDKGKPESNTNGNSGQTSTGNN